MDHLSPSTAQSYRKCGRLTLYEKLQGRKNTTVYAMTQYGSAMHEAVETWMKAKQSGIPVNRDFLIKLFTEKFDVLANEVTIWGNDSKEHLMCEGEIATKDLVNILKDINPVAIEKKYEIDRGQGKMPIISIADCIGDDGVIYDYKFGRGLYGYVKGEEYMINMTTYAMGYFNEHGVYPRIKMIKQVWKAKQKDKIKNYYHERFEVEELNFNEAWINYYIDVYDMVEDGINAGIFMPPKDGDTSLCRNCCFRNNPCNIVANRGF